ncbi:unnamed protein product [Parascedosporium putredinis]|uniref:DEAD-domain-containing protein n=1 Tax=Parascedosporium putredinis TaxID=1442378 RepID=A0A9P1GV33_9PEZI|nr:unnamed protein product [Parascedosporium putredinis]CAI7988192.1 unnamed protein product [Parascedosporium putredinis]
MSDAWGTSEMTEALPSLMVKKMTPTHRLPALRRANPPPRGMDPKMIAASEALKKMDWTPAKAYDYSTLGPGQEENWDGAARIYEWDGEIGEVAPEHPELELELFGTPESRGEVRGIDFTKIAEIEVTQEGPVEVELIKSFKDAGLHPVMLRNIELAGYDAPTPIQKCTIPAIHRGYDTIAIAQTGSGKTAAYLIPILDKLMGKAKKLAGPRPNQGKFQEGVDPYVRAEPLVVIVAPARELAVQIFNEARKFCYRTMLRPCVCYGGGPIRDQIRLLGKGCDILVATPGRLVDFLGRPDVLSLKRLRYLVIDEADEMLQEDWQTDLDRIMVGSDQDEGQVTYLLFSVTFPKHIRNLAQNHLRADHVRFRIGRAGSTHSNIKQTIVRVEHDKRQSLLSLLSTVPPAAPSSL